MMWSTWTLPFLSLAIPLLSTMAKSEGIFRQAGAGPQLVSANGKFAWDLFRQLAEKSPGDNVFFSPTSISFALAMTYLGCQNQTREQMRSALGFSDIEDDHLHMSYEDIHGHLHKPGENYTLHSANRLYIEKTYPILESYLGATKTHYKAEAIPVDFQKQFEEARSAINQWVEEQTASKIKDLLPSGVLDSLTRLVLVNAIYFKGNWMEKFDPKRTKDGEFHVSASEKVPVKLMFQDKKFNYGYNQDLGAKVLELPYVGGKLSMFLLLPVQSHDLNNVLSKLTSEHLLDMENTFQMRKMKTQVFVPRFKLEQSFDLGDVLSSLGMSDLFDQSRADLSGIDGSQNLYVSKVLHKAFIEVNEEGSEAAAATAVKIGLRSMPRIMEFRADQPFLFFIRDNISKTVLFMGKMTRPVSPPGKDEL